MAKANKHNRRAKKLKQRKATTGSKLKATTGSKFSKSIDIMSGFGMSIHQKLAQAAAMGADSLLDLDNPFGPQMWFKEGDQWVKL
jgi:hypothetical protein